MGIAEEIERLEDLHAAGSLSNEEFAEAKSKVLTGDDSSSTGLSASGGMKGWLAPKEWGMVLHLSQFCGILVPWAGWVVPIGLWQVLKNEVPHIDEHGKMVVNWIISATIYSVAGAILAVVVVGFFLLIALAIMAIAFPIIGALKANEGVIWEYPLTIRFLQ